MTTDERQTFLCRFAVGYDLAGAAKEAGVEVEAARQLLEEEDARRTVDAHVTARRQGEVLSRIVREYERIAFGSEDDAKAGDRLRALEQLRLIASAEARGGAAPTLSIVVSYV